MKRTSETQVRSFVVSATAALAIVVGTAGTEAGAANNWPQWRGPNLDGTTNETGQVDGGTLVVTGEVLEGTGAFAGATGTFEQRGDFPILTGTYTMELTVPASAADPDFVGSPDPVSDADGSEADADAEVTDPDADDIVELDGDRATLTLAAGTYRSEHLGVPITFSVPELVKVGSLEPGAIWLTSYGPGDLFRGLVMTRVGSWFAPDEAADPAFTGLGSIAPDAVDEWLLRNGIPVEESSEVTIGGRAARYRAFTIPLDQSNTYDDPAACHYPEWQPCFWADSASADTFDPDARDFQVMTPGGFHRLWLVDMADYEPLMINVYGTAGADDERMARWLDEVVPPIIDSIELGDPAPAVPGGTARVPERITVTAEMVVTQTGEPDLEEAWPIERTGTISGGIDGTIAGTGVSSPNNAEVTMDLVMDVTIDGLGTGTLTLRSHQTWSGDGYIVAADYVIGGTGDIEGVTGFGTTRHTESFPGGEGFRATIEVHLAPTTD